MTARRIEPEDIQALAAGVLRRNGVRMPPVDVQRIARDEGLDFSFVALERTSGAYFRDRDGHGHVVISSTNSRVRQRFTIAHELAHHLMDEPAVSTAPLLPAGYRGRDRHWAHEYFAGCLLMPRPWVANVFRARGIALSSDELAAEIARRFDVSRAAALVRMRELGYENGWR